MLTQLGAGIFRGGPLARTRVCFGCTAFPGAAVALAILWGAPAAAQQARSVAPGDTSRLDSDRRPVAGEPDAIVRSAPGGTPRRREVGYSVAVLDSGDLSMPGVRTLSEALQGRVPGMTVLGAPDFAGVGRDFVLRGAGSWLSSDRPLVFVDGVRVADITYPAGLGVDQAPDPLDDIDPETIDRVEVVRGPAADALYGAGDAAGAIYVFTRRGTRGPPVWSVTTDQGTNWLGHVGPDAGINPTGLGLNDCSGTTGCPASGTWLQAGREQRYRASVRGGGSLLGYAASGHWARETDVIAPQGSRDWSARGNLDVHPLRSLEIRLEGARAARGLRWVPQDFLSSVMLQDTAWLPGGNDSLLLQIESTQETAHTTVGAGVAWTPIPALPQRIMLGLDRATSLSLEMDPATFGRGSVAGQVQEDWRLRTESLAYDGAWNQRLGAGARSSLSWDAQINSLRLDDYMRWDYAGPPSTSTYRADVTTRQLALRERLALWNRLFVAGAMRWRDATSWDNVGFEAFPAAQVSYMLSGHRFWPRWWESLQLRAAIGWSGQATRAALPFSLSVASVPPGSSLPTILPERARETEVGLQSSMFGGRLALEYTYYDQRTSNVQAVVGVLGPGAFSYALANVETITNRGHELLADVTVLHGAAVRWQLGAQWSTNHSEARKLDPRYTVISGAVPYLPGGGVFSGMVDGLSVPSYYGWTVVNPDEVGVPPIYEPQAIGPMYPTFAYALSTRLTLADRLVLNLQGEGQGGNFLLDGTAAVGAWLGTWPGCAGIRDKVLAGDISGLTAWQQSACVGTWATFADWTLPAGFFRLRYASATYRLPDRWTRRVGRTRVSVIVRNPLLITHYPGVDPEGSTVGSAGGGPGRQYRAEVYALPQPRSVVLSLRIER